MRISFEKGKQREFLDLVIERLDAPSLRGILQFGFDVNYSTLKNYYNESRNLSKELFEDLCGISGLNMNDFNFVELSENWGRSKGGKLSKK